MFWNSETLICGGLKLGTLPPASTIITRRMRSEKGVACERANEGVWSKVAHPIGRITLIPADGLYNKQKGRRHDYLGCDITNPPSRLPLSLCAQSPERLYAIPAQKGGQSEGLNTPTHPCFSPIPVLHGSILVSFVGQAPLM